METQPAAFEQPHETLSHKDRTIFISLKAPRKRRFSLHRYAGARIGTIGGGLIVKLVRAGEDPDQVAQKVDAELFAIRLRSILKPCGRTMCQNVKSGVSYIVLRALVSIKR